VRAALAGQRPDIVLIEGPPEADDLVKLAADPDMRPPVALLGYVPGEPRLAAFWPFAVFSPEWQAIRYALSAGSRSGSATCRPRISSRSGASGATGRGRAPIR